ncbi:MAG TPA: hypothetical protein VKK31_14700 [Thermoanaerobaculia bacterium]|nr:hypothetical protein [Thermoanaerobaculia bacterium]
MSPTAQEAMKSRRLLLFLLGLALVLSLVSSVRAQSSETSGASRSTRAVLTSPPQ